MEPTQAKSISILRPPLLATGGVLALLSAITAVWSCTAQIPENVYGTAALQKIESTYQAVAPTNGLVVYPLMKKGRSIAFVQPGWVKESYQYLKDPDGFTHQRVERLAKQVAGDVFAYQTQTKGDLFELSGSSLTGRDRAIKLREGDMVAYVLNDRVKSSLMQSVQKLESSNRLYAQLLAKRSQSLETQKKLYQEKSKMIPGLLELYSKGFLSKIELLQSKDSALSADLSISNLQEQLDQTAIKILDDREALRNALSSFVMNSVLFNYQDAVINGFRAGQWSYVQPGSPVAQLRWDQQPDQVVIPVAIDQVPATEIALGMEVILTPLGFNRAEIGGIKGTIVGMETDPQSTEILAQKLGSPGLATLLAPQGSIYLAYVALQRETITGLQGKLNNQKRSAEEIDPNRGGYVWNNRSHPPIQPRDGFLLTAQITTRHRTPIEMLLPALREVLGLETPHQFELLQIKPQ